MKTAVIMLNPTVIKEIKKKVPQGYTVEQGILFHAIQSANLQPEFSEVPQEVWDGIVNNRYKVRWIADCALVEVPVFSSKVKYTCGTCGRGVHTTPQHGDTRLKRSGATALYCAKCDDIFCIQCGVIMHQMRQMRTRGENVPCGNCGGPVSIIDDTHHPSWYPRQRPPNKIFDYYYGKEASSPSSTPTRAHGKLDLREWKCSTCGSKLHRTNEKPYRFYCPVCGLDITAQREVGK